MDTDSTLKIALAILNLCFELKEWKQLNDHISLLCKRRAQSVEKVVKNIVQRGVEMVEMTPDKETKRDLIETLRTVSAGKIVVELERARLTRMISEMKEEEGDVDKAAEILQAVYVETIGSMETREKAAFLLDQVRLCMAKKDYVRVEIISNKINPKTLQEEKLEDLKLKYYYLMNEFYKYRGDYLASCKAWLEVFRTKSIQEDVKKSEEALNKTILYCILAPFDSEVSDLLHRLQKEPMVMKIPRLKGLLENFTTTELMHWPLQHEKEWKQQEVFQGEKGDERWSDMHKRVVQHNIRVIAEYYEKMTMKRLANLLQLDEAKVEEHLSEMVTSKQIFARIDRPAGIISFAKKKSAAEQLNVWSADISELLSLVEKTCHAINKENMMYGIKSA